MDWSCLPGRPCWVEFEVQVTRKESHNSLVMWAKNVGGNSGDMYALYLPSLFCFFNQESMNKDRTIIKAKCQEGQLVRGFSSELSLISQEQWWWSKDSLSELNQTLFMSLDCRNPQFGTLGGFPGLPGTVYKWLDPAHRSSHQLDRYRNSVLLLCPELIGLLGTALQESYSWDIVSKIKCKDFPRIQQFLSAPPTQLVIRKAPSHGGRKRMEWEERKWEGSEGIFHTSQEKQIKYLCLTTVLSV